jgi:hypothetical protein
MGLVYFILTEVSQGNTLTKITICNANDTETHIFSLTTGKLRSAEDI